MIEMLDKDGDEALSFEEFRRAPWLKDLGEDEQEEQFEKIDRDGDLLIRKEELPPAPPQGGKPPKRKRGEPGPRDREKPE
jgi:Ca2+-binding EF-hand superfamily protein